jgi:hypothetical protein
LGSNFSSLFLACEKFWLEIVIAWNNNRGVVRAIEEYLKYPIHFHSKMVYYLARHKIYLLMKSFIYEDKRGQEAPLRGLTPAIIIQGPLQILPKRPFTEMDLCLICFSQSGHFFTTVLKGAEMIYQLGLGFHFIRIRG